MLHNYLKIAIRNLLRNKGFSAINISGLAIGMASALLILLWVHNELTFDRWYPNTSRLYQLYNRDNLQGNLVAWPNTPKPLAPFIKKDFPDVEDVTRYRNVIYLLSTGDTRLNSRGACADSAFLKMFGLPMIQGDAAHALSSPGGIVLTRQMAKNLFGNSDPMGKIVRIDSNTNFTVTGVLKDLPANTSFQFDYLLPWSFVIRTSHDNDQWGTNSVFTFVLLKPGASQAAFDREVRDITIAHSDRKETTQVFTQPMARLHLYSKSENGVLVGDRVHIVRLFALIAGFILLIACINFMNLSTARSEKRAREVGIRKVVGAFRGYLIGQFIGESILIAALSFILALLLTHLTLDAFNQLVGTRLVVEFDNPVWWAFAIGFVVFTGLLAGSYPAFYLSAFQPVKVLKGTYRKVNALISTRRILVILQFSFATILIIATLTVWRQIRHAQDRNAGYNRNQLVYTFNQGEIPNHYEAIKHDLLASGAVLSINRSLNPITQHWSDSWGYSWDGCTPADKRIDFISLSSDVDFLKTMGASLAAGRDIDIYKYPTDSNAVILNESAVRTMRVKNPVGMTIRSDDGRGSFHVIGVVKDFILESPYDNIAPMMIFAVGGFFQVIHMKLNPAWPVAANKAQLEKVFKQYNPQYPAPFIFVDEAYAGKFKAEQQVGTLAALFAGLTIFISCLGLFALAAYMAENRIREIGVRKVLGASVTGITTMLAKDFVWLVLIAFVVSAPISWWIMHDWLTGFNYRVGMGWDIFALSGGLALVIAVATVSYQAIRAALANPVKALRSE
ncbi:MAG TPA: ABC transporter permease [Puia sp.]|uniref:ABC transporter permease n=1 Tax=Puia sp. TaxID=2045100 RepID=UPI002C0A0418|nr:ABC transporter permease [Puia sp.]HVU99622.1 ABC transporter permease [Puia sp.]